MFATLLLCAAAQASSSPLDFAHAEISQATGNRSGDVKIEVRKGKTPESFTIDPHDGKVSIVGSDPTGAMYGAFEFAERLKNEGEKAWTETAKAEPYLRERGVNLFLTLPWDYKRNDTDDSVAALTDPKRWWFQDEHYWTTLLDLMAHSRLNWLDIHGTWDISVTDAPNLYAYFVTSPTFPKVGVPDDVKATDIKQLNHVIEMAHARGIKVSLMSYEARFHTPENPDPPYKATEENLYKYTREVVEAMIRATPKLDAIGFRIGESGHSASFFKCYTDAVKHSGRDIPLITRTWVTRKQAVLPLARASKDFTAEIKYNGEQWAAPYMVVGGRMANWGSYSFEDYLSDSGPGKAAKMWTGQPAEGGGNWPSEPYKVVWQVRANGTHRIFPFYNPDWVRRSIKCMRIGTASGYTVEGEDAYYPKDPLYYLANPADKYVDYIHQRDELYWMTWGRLGYDPATPDSTFDAVVYRWFPQNGFNIARAWKAMSTIVPQAYLAYAQGPDHRDEAPELETGGDSDAFIQGEPFDPFVFSSSAAGVLMHDGRIPRSAVIHRLFWAPAAGVKGFEVFPESRLPMPSRARYRELAAAYFAESGLATYYACRFSAADTLAGRDAGHEDAPGERSQSVPEWIVKGWHMLEIPFYKPFTERLRMHTNNFTWASEDSIVANAVRQIELEAGSKPLPYPLWEDRSPRSQLPANLALRWESTGSKIEVSVHDPLLIGAKLLYKPLPSSTFFHSAPMHRAGGGFAAELDRPRCGLCFAVQASLRSYLNDPSSEVIVARYPRFESGDTPYLVVPAQPGPTPPIYATDEALDHLDPAILTPKSFGTIVVAPRAARFFGFPKAQKRKLLEGVKRGMKLLILQQDFAAKRYALDFLPKPLNINANPTPSNFDPEGQLGLEKLESHDIQWQKFAPSEGWDVYGSGGLARLKVGKGEVWVTSARLMQRATDSSVAKDLQRLLRAFVTPKPAILVDAGTESAIYTTSFWPDLMNDTDIPFVTLGEAIAQAQGISSSAVVAGPVENDDVLGGKGSELANTFLRGQVVAASKRPTPPSLTAFEADRKHRKHELLRTLGLDPMPARTLLNARVTGRIQRDGFYMEKVVIESRPSFFVTMHVYVPGVYPAEGAHSDHSLPVVMNVIGHWAHKKDEDRVQLRCEFQALQGYLAVAVDSPGFSFEGDALIERRAEGSHNDFKLVEGGTNTTGYYVWDTMRALDYVSTRKDADMNHVGITGASGGGLATLYTFAADDRYMAAVPVVYMASMELAPDNGCLCNHVPGTSQIGDRSDVIAIQAPKPVLIMGAQNDGEFPPDAMRLTQKKMAESWALFGKADDTFVKIFSGGHDYNQGMRESMIGFFNKYLKGQGDGSPVPQPTLTTLDPQDHSILVLDPPEPDERTMRILSTEYLDQAPVKVLAADAIAVNGGLPRKVNLDYSEKGDGRKRQVVFDSEPGLQTPAILFLPEGKPKGVRIVADDAGKKGIINNRDAQAMTEDGYAVLVVDILGTGELDDIQLRYPTYMGRSIAFTAGWQLVRAAEAMAKYSHHVQLTGRGPLASQAVMWAGLQAPKTFDKVTGLDCLANWQAVISDAVPDVAVQPRANLCGSLENLRKQVRNGEWKVGR